MKRFRCMVLALLAGLLLAACGDLGQLMETAEGALPKFQGGVPNLLCGTWMVKSNAYEGSYLYRLTLMADGTFTMEGVDESTTKGTYSFSYDHLDLLAASGTITFSPALPPDGQSHKIFTYKADVDKGPQTLILSGVSYVFVQR